MTARKTSWIKYVIVCNSIGPVDEQMFSRLGDAKVRRDCQYGHNTAYRVERVTVTLNPSSRTAKNTLKARATPDASI